MEDHILQNHIHKIELSLDIQRKITYKTRIFKENTAILLRHVVSHTYRCELQAKVLQVKLFGIQDTQRDF